MQGSDEDVSIEYNDTNAQYRFGDSSLTCRLIDGKYPNYEAVIPNENPNVLTIDRTQFLNSLKRVSIFSNKTTHQVRLKLAGAELNVSAEDIDFSNKAEERLTCDYKGEDIEIDRPNNRAKVKEINMVKKHVKTTKEKKGGIVSKESFIHLSNLKLIDEKAAKKTEAKK